MGLEVHTSMHILVLICNQLLDPVCTVEISSDDHLAVS